MLCIYLLSIGKNIIALPLDSIVVKRHQGVAIFAAGFGSRVSALSLVSSWVEKDIRASLYTVNAVLENIGHAVGDPSMQHIFAAVVDRSRPWLAMRFFMAAVGSSKILIY